MLPGSYGQAGILSLWAPGQALSGVGSLGTYADQAGGWGTADKAVFHPIRISHPVIARKLHWIAGATISGNYDIGLYDATGRRLASSGSTAVPGTGVVVSYDMTDLYLTPQIVYLALALSSATCRYYGWVVSGEGPEMRASGLVSQASAVPLPDSATWAAFDAPALPDLYMDTAVYLA
jgi:hypothetical protein